MRKSLLILPVLFCGLLNAQTVVFSDNFDSYTAGMGVAEQSDTWTTWDGSLTYDAEVSDNVAASGSNSVMVDGTNVDLVLPIGPYTSGKYDLKFKMYVTDAGAYFNLMHIWSADDPTYEWACDIFVDGTGAVTTVTGAMQGTGTTVTIDEWFDVQVTADLDDDWGKVYINGEVIAEWQWSLNNADGTAGTNALVAADFYGTNSASGQGLYYIDDVVVEESTGVNTEEISVVRPTFFPNPASEMLNIQLPQSWDGANVSIANMEGQLVYNGYLGRNADLVDVRNLTPGVYMLHISGEETTYVEKLIIR